MVKIGLNFNKICFMPYSTTISIKKKTPPPKKKPKAVEDRGGEGSRVGMTAVKDSMVFLEASLTHSLKDPSPHRPCFSVGQILRYLNIFE